MDMAIADVVTFLGKIVIQITGLTILFWICRSIYRLYFHPLSKFPGPKLAAISDIYYALQITSGRWPFKLEQLHRRYGPVVRIDPNTVIFATVEAYRDIYVYNMREKDKILIKADHYAGRLPNVFNERNPEKHARVRKRLSPAFSIKAIHDQEHVVQQYVDLFIAQIGKMGRPGGVGVNLREALNWLTFDIIGDLTFGESFGAVQAGKTPFWVKVINDAAYINSNLNTIIRRIPIAKVLLPWTLPKGYVERAQAHRRITEEKVRKRLEIGNSMNRDDFFSHLFGDSGDGGETYQEMLNQSGILMTAGSETIKTTVCSTVWLLLRYPETLAKLKEEVRSRFATASEITGYACAQLEYLHAVIDEGLRVFPPGVGDLQRETPAQGAEISGHYIPGGYSVGGSGFTTSRDARYWHEPLSFIPSRWIGKGFEHDNKEATQAFSLGPRNCIGINLAYLEMRIILVKMVFTYDWELVNKDMDLFRDSKHHTFWRTPDMMVIFHPRSV